MCLRHLISDKGGKNIQWRKDSLFNKGCWKTAPKTSPSKRMKLEHSLMPYTEGNLKQMKDLKCKAGFYRGNIGRTLFDINHRKIFFNPLLRVMKINKCDLMKVKSFCTAKKTK